jgi:hypothetical protein
LLGASTGFQSFAVIGNANTCYYTISDQGGPNWEVGIGTYSTTGPTLARTTVLASSNAGSLTDFNAGTQDVFVTYPAEKGLWLDASGNAIGLGTPAAFVGTNITGTATALSIGGNAATATTAGTVTTNANLTGAVTSVGNATSLGSFTSANLAGALTDETGSGSAVFATSPTLVTPALGTPSALVGTNITGTASGLTAGTVTTNANLTGPITSVGNATSIASQTGTGTKFVVDNTPTLITPVLGVATGTSLSVSTTVTGAELLASNGLIINNMTIGTTYSIPSGYSASSVGPVVISGGVTITVGAGSRWVVL